MIAWLLLPSLLLACSWRQGPLCHVEDWSEAPPFLALSVLLSTGVKKLAATYAKLKRR